MTIIAFFGFVEFKLSLRAMGHAVQRKVRARYAYTPPWSFLDPKSGVEKTLELALDVGLDLLAMGRLDKGRSGMTSAHKRYWTPVDQLLAIGVLRTEIYEKLRQLIDADARQQDLQNRKTAGLPVPIIGSPDYL